MKGVIFIMPIIQALVFGYAVTTDVRNVATAVMDLDNTSASREPVARSKTPCTSPSPCASVTMTTCATRSTAAKSAPSCASTRASRANCLRDARRASIAPLDGTDSNTAGNRA